jgi:hypothetical protein
MNRTGKPFYDFRVCQYFQVEFQPKLQQEGFSSRQRKKKWKLKERDWCSGGHASVK